MPTSITLTVVHRILYVDVPKQTDDAENNIFLNWGMLFSIIDCMPELQRLRMDGDAGYLEGDPARLRLQRQSWEVLDLSSLCVLRIKCDPIPLFHQLFYGPARNSLKLKQLEVWCNMDSPSITATIYPLLYTIAISHLDCARFLCYEKHGGNLSVPRSPECDHEVCRFYFSRNTSC